MILIKLAKNKNKTIKEAYGKYYARPVVTETIGIDELAEHMASHNTPFSKGAIKGLLTDMVSCVKELVLQNKAVKIDNLAIFSIGIINKMGAASIKEWSLAKFVEGYRLRARATGKLSNTQLSLDANAKNAMDLLNSLRLFAKRLFILKTKNIIAKKPRDTILTTTSDAVMMRF